MKSRVRDSPGFRVRSTDFLIAFAPVPMRMESVVQVIFLVELKTLAVIVVLSLGLMIAGA